ncbi:hypothetical protein [Hyphomonas jannaschiana]|nr:hypothetical protein [Hyphomonas jannaschiana]
MKKFRNAFPIMLLGVLPACASHDYQDQFLLGGASTANIAEQSIRDVTVPNSEANQSASGVRAANAVRALNEGKRKELKPSGLNGSGETS